MMHARGSYCGDTCVLHLISHYQAAVTILWVAQPRIFHKAERNCYVNLAHVYTRGGCIAKMSTITSFNVRNRIKICINSPRDYVLFESFLSEIFSGQHWKLIDNRLIIAVFRNRFWATNKMKKLKSKQITKNDKYLSSSWRPQCRIFVYFISKFDYPHGEFKIIVSWTESDICHAKKESIYRFVDEFYRAVFNRC